MKSRDCKVSKNEVSDLVEKISELVIKNPDKAAIILTAWVAVSQKK